MNKWLELKSEAVGLKVGRQWALKSRRWPSKAYGTKVAKPCVGPSYRKRVPNYFFSSKIPFVLYIL